MFTRSSVHCADRIVAASSSKGLRWSRRTARRRPGYSSAQALERAAGAPGGGAGSAFGGGRGRRAGIGTARVHAGTVRPRCATSRSPAPHGPGPPRATRARSWRWSVRRWRSTSADAGATAADGRRRAGRIEADRATHGGGRLRLWARGPPMPHQRRSRARRAVSSGASCYQLRRPLPVDAPWDARRAPVRRRAGRGGLARGQQPGVRAGTPSRATGRSTTCGPGAPSRGSTRRASCCTRRTGALAGFCWTKVHRATDAAARRDLRDRRRPAAHRPRPRPRARPSPGSTTSTAPGLDVGMLYVEARQRAPRCASTTRLGFTRAPHRPRPTTSRCSVARADDVDARRRHPLRPRPRRARRAARRPAALPRRPGLDRPLRAAGVTRASSPTLPKAPPGASSTPRSRSPSTPVDRVDQRRRRDREVAVGARRRHPGRDGAHALRRPLHRVRRRARPAAPWGAAFCATGQAGFDRHLTVGEIVEQVVRAGRRARDDGRRLSNVVFMGMGEPLANYERHVGGRRAAPRRPRPVGPPPHRVHRRHRPRHPPPGHRGPPGEPGRVAARRRRRAARRARADQPALPAVAR